VTLDIRLVPALRDNYVFLVHDPGEGVTAVVDPAEEAPVLAALDAAGWGLDLILNTHHHPDHVGANQSLKRRFGLTVVGPAADRERIPGIDVAVGTGGSVSVGAAVARVYDVPGHTRGHIAYWFEGDAAVFVGDTLFAGGCGRMFEGTPDQFWASLDLLRGLPDDTRVFCAHEYTTANLRFAVTVDADNAALRARVAAVAAAGAAGAPTVPSTIGMEKATNPFLRCDRPEVAAAVGLPMGAPAAVFGAVRAAKDGFRG
jgi:hydroxyacylglutathione hydrolase